MVQKREEAAGSSLWHNTNTLSHHFSCISLKALTNTNTMNISHSDCICPAGASTWDEAVYLNLSTLQEPSIRPLTHTRRRSERPTRVPLVRSFTLQHSHPFWVSVLRLYSSVCFHCVKLFNVTSKHNSLCILRLKWNTHVVEKLLCCYGFTCTTKHFMIDSTTQCAGRREEGNLWFFRPEAYSPQPVLTVQEYSRKSAYLTFYHEE